MTQRVPQTLLSYTVYFTDEAIKANICFHGCLLKQEWGNGN